MSQRRNDQRKHLPQPKWNPLRADPSPSEDPSEDEILESSQEMRDELLSSPDPDPRPRKRKPSNARSPLRLTTTTTTSNAHKRPRLGSKERHVAESSHSRHFNNDGDVPASAHAKPVRRLPAPSSSSRRSSLPTSKIASALRSFETARGAIPSSSQAKTPTAVAESSTGAVDRSVTVSRKTLGSKPPRFGRPSHANSTSAIRPKPLSKDRDRRKTLPATFEPIDLTNLSDDEINALPSPTKPISRKIVAPLKVSGKKYETLGKEDNPISLLDSDEEEPADPERGSPHASHDAHNDRHEDAALESDSGMNFENETISDSPATAVVTSSTQLNEVANTTQSPSLDTIVPSLDHMAISPVKNTPRQTPLAASAAQSVKGKGKATMVEQVHELASLPRPSDAMDVDQPQVERLQSPFSPAPPASKPSSTPARPPQAPITATPPAKPSLHSPVMGGRTTLGMRTPDTPRAIPPSQSSASPQRRIRAEDTLYSGPTGFFKAVHQRRASSGRTAVQASTTGSTPQAAQTPADSPTSSIPEERASDGYASSVATGHELPPSSEVSRSGSMEPLSHAASTTSLPLVEAAKAEVVERPASQGPPPSAAKQEVGNTSLINVLAAARLAHAQKEEKYIDLTLSDSEDEVRPTTWSDPEDIGTTTNLLADIVPALFNDDLASVLPPPAPAPPPKQAPPLLDLYKAIQRSVAQKQSPVEAASSTGSGSDSFPVSRRTSIDIPISKGKKPQIPSSSSERDAPRMRKRVSPQHPTLDAVDMEVDGEQSPPIVAPRARGRPRKQLRAGSPPGSGSEYGKGESSSEAEIQDLLLSEERSESPETSNEKKQYNLRERKPFVKKPLVPMAPPPSRGRGRRPRVTRNGPTEQALLPAMGQMAIYSDDSDDDDPQVLTWRKHGRQLQLEYAEVNMRARDLPFNLQDRILVLDLGFRKAENMQLNAFKSSILVASGGDEPNAPEIRIVNEIDDEPSPPFEFHYTNKMYHGEGVAPPDLEHLDHCNCVGFCRPETCPCAKKQMHWMHILSWGKKDVPDPLPAFAYDANGRIVPDYHDQHPIFECNAKCRCDDEYCQNRVVQKGRKVKVNIKKTPNKGWGVFAGEFIPAHTFIGVYTGEILTDAEGTERGEKYDEFGRTYLFNIDGYHITQWQLFHGKPKKTNFCVDAYHAGNFTRYLNHSCKPNCNIVVCYINEPDIEKGLLTIWTTRDVAAGAELCFSYFGDPDKKDFRPLSKKEKARLTKNNSFCQCGEKPCAKRMWRYESDEDGSTDDGTVGDD